MKVLTITYYPPAVGGIETHVDELTDELSDRHEVEVLWFTNDTDSELSSRIRQVAATAADCPGDSMVLAAWKQAKVLMEHVDDFDPDVIHAHSMGLCYGLGLVKLRMLGTPPVVVTNHSSRFLNRFYSDSFSTTLKQRVEGAVPDTVITPSEELKKASQAVTSAPVVEIPNGVDTERFHPDVEPELDEYDTEGRFVVLTTRRFVPKNGMKYLVKSIPHTDEDVFFLLLGDGPERKQLRRWIEDRGLSDRVAMPGEIPNEEIDEYYALADVSVLPSLKEAISISALESMANGTPVIGTAVGGLPELIKDGANGLIVEPKDPEAIASAITSLANDPVLLDEMSREARETILANYSWGAIGERTEQIYRQLVSD